MRFHTALYLLALFLLNRFVQHLQIKVVAHHVQMTRLLTAQDIARAAQLKVAHGYLDSRTELRELAYRHQSLRGDVGQLFPAVEGQIRIRPAVAPSHSAAYLMQL